MGKYAQLEVSSSSQIQDFVLDVLVIRNEPTMFSDQSDKF